MERTGKLFSKKNSVDKNLTNQELLKIIDKYSSEFEIASQLDSDFPAPIQSGWMKKIAVHLVDLLFVFYSMLVVAIMVWFLFGFELGTEVTSLKAWSFFKMLRSSGVFGLVGIVYLLFAVYWATFRLFAGGTVGNFLLRQKKRRSSLRL